MSPALTPEEAQGWRAVAMRKPIVWQFTPEQEHARAVIEARMRNVERRKTHELRTGADERRTA